MFKIPLNYYLEPYVFASMIYIQHKSEIVIKRSKNRILPATYKNIIEQEMQRIGGNYICRGHILYSLENL